MVGWLQNFDWLCEMSEHDQSLQNDNVVLEHERNMSPPSPSGEPFRVPGRRTRTISEYARLFFISGFLSRLLVIHPKPLSVFKKKKISRFSSFHS